MPSIQWNGPKAADWIVGWHGAGASMDSDFMQFMAEALAERGLRVGRFNFLIWNAQPKGKPRPPDAMKNCWPWEVIHQVFGISIPHNDWRLVESRWRSIASMSTHLLE